MHIARHCVHKHNYIQYCRAVTPRAGAESAARLWPGAGVNLCRSGEVLAGPRNWVIWFREVRGSRAATGSPQHAARANIGRKVVKSWKF